MIKLLVFCSLGFVLLSCNNKINEKDLLAKVYDKTLSRNDLNEVFPKSLKGKDSINFVNSYIKKWIEKNVLIYNANNNLTDEQKNFENEMEEYKSSLLIYNYEKEFIFQKLDTVVAEKEIEKKVV